MTLKCREGSTMFPKGVMTLCPLPAEGSPLLQRTRSNKQVSLQAKCTSLSTLYTTLLSSESSSLADSIAGAALLNFAKAYAATMEQVL